MSQLIIVSTESICTGTYNRTREVAIKKITSGATNVEEFRREAFTMKALRHPHIVILYAVCMEDASSILIVTEYMNKGSLKHVLDMEGHRISFPELLEICTQVTQHEDILGLYAN